MSAAASFQLATYRLLARALPALPFRGKLGRSLGGRNETGTEWLAGIRAGRGKVVWIHAASVGEAIVAEPVIRRLRTALPDLQVALTCSSPSLAEWPRSFGQTVAGYAPPERPAAVAQFFDALRPDLLAFSRSDLWPELLVAAQQRAVPVAVFGATVRQRSLRLRWPAKSFLRAVYAPIRFLGAISDEDADRWQSLGVRESVIAVTGDPRHDQVLERVSDLAALVELRPWAAAGPTLVAGSVEETDEVALLTALAAVGQACAGARMLLVPHEPADRTVQRLRQRARQAGVSLEVYSRPRPSAASCLVILERGNLSDLYALGSVSYVGGGFRPRGLHAVVEPAAFGLPVLLGPEYAGSSDAMRLVGAGGAAALPRREAAATMTAHWQRWMQNDTERNRVGLAARGTLREGAAGATARHLLALLEKPVTERVPRA